MNIHRFLQKSKQMASGDFYIVSIIILVGFAGFGLGRLSIIEESREPVRIEYPQHLSATVLNSQDSAVSNEVRSAGEGLLVASKNGSKYHFPWCSGGKSISEKNKIWFDSVEDARKAGYTPAANCKGLK
jgi:hypothetical protein